VRHVTSAVATSAAELVAAQGRLAEELVALPREATPAGFQRLRDTLSSTAVSRERSSS
jgi:hypothetical protein